MDHIVLEWQMIQHRGYEIVGISKLLQLQIFFINMSHMDCTVYLHERVYVCANVSSLYLGHRITLVTKTLGIVIVTHEFDWEVDWNMEHKSPIHQTSPIVYNFFMRFSHELFWRKKTCRYLRPLSLSKWSALWEWSDWKSRNLDKEW